ncbi:pseudouridine synthase / TruA [Leishmania donovani]|uniref:tRNA pseudouridine synthase n=1 Tax=Leishmania donovani TaxID=5661 RepID=A0A3S7X3E8_LEIDO|nr:pseudouridine synthase A-like protein, putative [Leishmania donovani]AYU80955.1 pseudouridine synthase A-like protein, putative [Leishmania donovani]CAJ1990942.1 pseudouridine synthase / TruA [Leishmania donovani]CBZ36178.1 pseudouridine synthase A-like protein, putative [Leishmania donovani]VDZ46792.1 pseudouridine_synthase_A-like_protein_putative/GeneDB:LmjF.30.1550 [Leishmania donovani]
MASSSTADDHSAVAGTVASSASVCGSREAAALPPTALLKLGSTKKQRTERAFLFDRYPSRKIALRLAYHGHVHDGLAKQKETDNTVEGLVCDALRRLRLIPEDGPHNFGRCGRTDKGVSALGNALSLTARASCTADAEPQLPPLDYCSMLNNVLPSTIRIVGCALVDDAFDARFSCVHRTYRYYFFHRGLNLEAMQEAAAFFLGTHNFRNFCKMDVVNVSNFVRTVFSVGLHPSEALPELISYLEIRANSFLYHQIRCIMEVLFLVGRGLEVPSVVQTLLERGDRKPTYPLADGTPLVLWDCGFDNVQWQMSHCAFHAMEQELQDISTALLIRATSAAAMRSQLFRWYTGTADMFRKDTLEKSDTSGEGRSRAVAWRDPELRRLDMWSITGCDWTDPGTAGQIKARKRDLLYYLRTEANKGQPLSTTTSCEEKTSQTAETIASAPLAPVNYVPLLQRETERTYEEEVRELSGKKRARYEVNEAKKAAAAAAHKEVVSED